MSSDLLHKSKPQPTAPSVEVSPVAVRKPSAPKPYSKDDDEDEDEAGFLRRYRVVLLGGLLLLIGAGYLFMRPSTSSAPPSPRKAAVPINITLPPPPLPPPPPPPKVEPPKLEEPREQMEEETAPVDEPPEEAPDDSPPPIGTNNVGNGPDDNFGLGKATAGSGNGKGRSIGGGGSRFGYYAGQVQNSVSSAIKSNPRTRSATLSVIARIWADANGRIIRATLSGSSGDPAIDAALKNEVLTGLQLPSPPPAGMKMPINLRVSARAAR